MTKAAERAALEWKRAVVALDGSRCVVHDDPADCELPQ